MKKHILAILAALGLSATAAPAMAGGSVYVSGTWNVPTYGYAAPTYYAPPPIYSAPVVAPYAWAPPVISFSFGRSYRGHRYHHHRGHHRVERRNGRRADHRGGRRARY